MGIVSNLLNAQRRSSTEESRRLTAAVDAALDIPLRNPDASPTDVVEAADAAYQLTVREIAVEKNPRPVRSDTHLNMFGDEPEPEVPEISDAEPLDGPQPRSDNHFLLVQDEEPGSAPDDDPPWDTSGDGVHISGRGPLAAAPSDVLDDGLDDDDDEQAGDYDEVFEPADDDDSDADEDTLDDEDVTTPAPVPAGIPSPTDRYVGVASPWGDAAELDPVRPAASAADPGDPTPAPTPAPSPRATPPPAPPFDDLEPDTEPSFAQRMRESVESTLSRIRGGGGPRMKWIAAGAAAIALIAAAAVFSLSGIRGEPPQPAGTVALPPAQTDNPEPARTEAPLVPATVSGKCVGDSDAVAPFAGEKSRAWVCGRANGLDGAVLNITFNKPVVITAITMVPGFNYVAPDGSDEWTRHRLVTGVTWRMGGKVFPQSINPTRTGVTMKFPSVITQEMSMTITASAPPPKGTVTNGIGSAGDSAVDPDATTAVSSIVITGYPVDPAG